jgi:hypothetical protein
MTGVCISPIRSSPVPHSLHLELPGRVESGRSRTAWDLSPDGKRVAVVTPEGTPEVAKQEHEIVMLQNFFDELRRKVPVGK